MQDLIKIEVYVDDIKEMKSTLERIHKDKTLFVRLGDKEYTLDVKSLQQYSSYAPWHVGRTIEIEGYGVECDYYD